MRRQMSLLTTSQVQSLPFDPYLIRNQASRGAWYGSGRWQPYAHPSPYRQSYSTSSHPHSQHSQTDHGLPSGLEYSTYQQTPQHLSWSRTNSCSSFSPYETATTSSYPSQPPDYMLPDTNPMAHNNSYLGYSCPSKPHHSHLWNDQPIHLTSQHATQLPPSIYQEQNAPYGSGNSYTAGALRNDQALQFPLSLGVGASSLITDRTLPNPGTRIWNGAVASSYEGQPTSAVSHRSSITWPGTESSSGVSHVSSHTSVSSGSGSINQDCLPERSEVRRESQDLGLHSFAFTGSPRTAALSDSVTITHVDACAQQPHTSSTAAELGALRCRTASQGDVSVHKSPSITSPRYNYVASCAASRSHPASSLLAQESNGTIYRTQHTSCRRRDTAADDFDSNSSSYRPSESTASIAGITNSSGY